MPKPDSLALIINSLFFGGGGRGVGTELSDEFYLGTEDMVTEKYKE